MQKINKKGSESGKILLEKGYALIDTSNRSRHHEEKHAIAITSTNIDYTILMNPEEKSKLFNHIKLKNPKFNKTKINLICHAIQLSILIKKNFSTFPGVFICADGYDPKLLKHHLKMNLNSLYDEKDIHIHSSLKEMFGKKNIADRSAYQVTNKDKKPNQILTLKNILKNLK